MTDRIRVLHVDDDPALLDVVASLIEHKCDDLSVTSVERPQSALTLLESGPFDCLVSDYRMPTMNGLQLRDAVCESHPTLPFLLFTNVPHIELDRPIPRQHYLEKSGPDQFEALAARVVRLVEERVLDCNGHSTSTGP
ncbi:response regulator [Haloprofundus salinisoli]|uniref:response regulator n=1 Tax=Haloprofundus salinisoli TaxID=2876193 RepID=UPI001CCDE046|nr:response regulator [Haloprofundus salinisoli]